MGKYDDSLGGSPMEYHLVSEVQIEKGPRLFWPHFGFFYKAIATKIEVYFYDLSTGFLTEILNEGLVNEINNPISQVSDWKYISKNLSTETKFKNMWDADTEKSWQVIIKTRGRQ